MYSDPECHLSTRSMGDDQTFDTVEKVQCHQGDLTGMFVPITLWNAWVTKNIDNTLDLLKLYVLNMVKVQVSYQHDVWLSCLIGF